MEKKFLRKSVLYGLLGSGALLSLYFLILTLLSGWELTKDQFRAYWYYITALAFGFGIQVSLYTYLRSLIKEQVQTGRVLAASGTASGAAMISCCAHYLTNILPVIASSGIAAFVGAYQVQFFWLGLVFNFLGIAYMLNKVVKFSKMP